MLTLKEFHQEIQNDIDDQGNFDRNMVYTDDDGDIVLSEDTQDDIIEMDDDYTLIGYVFDEDLNDDIDNVEELYQTYTQHLK